MKRTLTLLVATLFTLAMMAGTAGAQSQDWDDVQDPPFHSHPHLLLIDAEIDFEEETLTYDRCVDLANGRTLPKANHHNQVHQGTAGEALLFNGENTNLVAPHTCEELEAGL